MKICIMTSAHPCFDTRIYYKEAMSLKETGYDVVLLCQACEGAEGADIPVITVPASGNRIYRMLFTVFGMLLKAIKINAEVYHFHDPELFLAGVILKMFGKKVIWDIHEDIPVQIIDKHTIKCNFIKQILAIFARGFEKVGSFVFDHIVLAEDISERFNGNKTTMIRNFPKISLVKTDVSCLRKDRKYLIYHGGLTRARGIKEIYEVAYKLKDEIRIIIVGKWWDEELEFECAKMPGAQYVDYYPPVRHENVWEYLGMAGIGLCVLYPIANYVKALPVKVFEYMACGMPVVLSDFPLLREYFSGCAVFVDPKDPGDIARKIEELLDDTEKAERLGKKGRELVEKKYNWDLEKHKLLKIYSQLI